MKEYLLVAKGDNDKWNAMTEKDWAPVMDGFSHWIAKMEEKNLWIRGDRLSPKRADITKSGSTFQVTDGPFTETKEVLTGFFLFKAENMAHAIELSKGCPSLLHDSLQLLELDGDRS